MTKVEPVSEDRGQGNETGAGGKVAKEEGEVKTQRLPTTLDQPSKSQPCQRDTLMATWLKSGLYVVEGVVWEERQVLMQ